MIHKKYRIPLSIGLVLLGTYLIVVAYTPGGSRTVLRFRGNVAPSGVYGAKISPLFVLLGVSCYMGAFYFYKTRNQKKEKNKAEDLIAPQPIPAKEQSRYSPVQTTTIIKNPETVSRTVETMAFFGQVLLVFGIFGAMIKYSNKMTSATEMASIVIQILGTGLIVGFIPRLGIPKEQWARQWNTAWAVFGIVIAVLFFIGILSLVITTPIVKTGQLLIAGTLDLIVLGAAITLAAIIRE